MYRISTSPLPKVKTVRKPDNIQHDIKTHDSDPLAKSSTDQLSSKFLAPSKRRRAQVIPSSIDRDRCPIVSGRRNARSVECCKDAAALHNQFAVAGESSAAMSPICSSRGHRSSRFATGIAILADCRWVNGNRCLNPVIVVGCNVGNHSVVVIGDGLCTVGSNYSARVLNALHRRPDQGARRIDRHRHFAINRDTRI